MEKDRVLELAKHVCKTQSLVLVKPCNAGSFKHTFHVTRGAENLALKLIVGDIDNARIQREIGALKACSHTNISKLIDVHTAQWDGRDVVCLMEEFLDGGTLTEKIGGRQLNRSDSRALALAMSDALAHLADLDIVHRDIKPENIMFKADGTPILLDLGIARHLTATTLTQAWAAVGPGTPIYAAPEQLLNDMRLIDWRTDQFSLGVTMSIAHLGLHPFSIRADYRDVVDWVSARKPPSPQFVESAKTNQMDFLPRMVDPWPSKRFAKPAQLIAAWQAWSAA
jgi:serine/threonine protein kinase